MSKTSRMKMIIILSLIGVTISLYAFFHNAGFASGKFCSINSTFDCDIVNKGPYSQIVGIPVSLIGVIGYLFLAIGGFLSLRNPTDRSIDRFILLASIGGLLFSLYLTGIELFVLKTWCLICISSQTIILAILVLSIWNYRSTELPVK
ncbi:vitamin K epoxide reductase family protein [Candidatus Uhrbacteria bacterium]|nr:vitamin K epoxide reductase family protein [Candidatus Uhrbacteria bacterium]